MRRRSDGWARVMAVLIGATGLVLAAGGLLLLQLGGSPYYVVAGLALLLDAWLLWRADPKALMLFAAIFAATLAWSLWEAGLDWWPLAARLDVLFVLGLPQLLPAEVV